MYEIYDCFKFHDVTLTLISGLVFTFPSNYCQAASFLIPGGRVNRKRTMIFGQLPSAAMLFADFHAGTRKPQWGI